MRDDLTPIAQMLQRFLTELVAGEGGSFQAIGDRVGITGAHINNLANGRVSNPGPERQRQILSKLSVEIAAYLARYPADLSVVELARRNVGLPALPTPLRPPKPPSSDPRVPGRPRRARGQREAGEQRRRSAASGK